MNNEKMGQFISELRKSQQMTQKELAEKLNISDKAVSKWERGLSYPDISLLLPLSEVLGVTTTELLDGEKAGSEVKNIENSIVNALEYVKNTAKTRLQLTQSIWAAIFSILILIGIATVSIVDVAISGTFTWSLIPISSCILAWFIFFPTIKSGLKGVVTSLITFSLLIVPFLYVIDYSISRITDYDYPVFSFGVRIAPLSILYFWIAFFLFKKLKTKKLLYTAILVTLAIPLSFSINLMIAKMQDQPWVLQTVLNTISMTVVAIILFIIEFAIRKKRN